MKFKSKVNINPVRAAILSLAIVMSLGLCSWAKANPLAPQDSLADKVRHAVVMDPYYSVFDNIQYSVNGDTVTLEGQVTRPVLKSGIAKSVASIAGVSKVENNIQVLPVSSFDDSIRMAMFRKLYSSESLSRYGWGVVPSIHITVDHGHVTLTGMVDRQADKNIATILARSVPNVFSVDNNLQVKTPLE